MVSDARYVEAGFEKKTWNGIVGELSSLLAEARLETDPERQTRLEYRVLSTWRTLSNVVLDIARSREYPHEIYATIEFVHQALLALQGLQTVDVVVHSPRHVQVQSVVRETKVVAKLVQFRPDQYVLEMSLLYPCPKIAGVIHEPRTMSPAFTVEFSPRHVYACIRQAPDESRPSNSAYAREFTDRIIYSDWLQLRLFMRRTLRDYRECTR